MNQSELPLDPNGPAYQTRETRTGPPLEYVAEKLGNSLRSLHHIYGDVMRFVPEEATSEALDALNVRREQSWRQTLLQLGQPDSQTREFQPQTMRQAVLAGFWDAFRSGLIAFLALHNFLGLANDDDFPQRLINMNSDQFDDWLRDIEEKGWISDRES